MYNNKKWIKAALKDHFYFKIPNKNIIGFLYLLEFKCEIDVDQTS